MITINLLREPSRKRAAWLASDRSKTEILAFVLLGLVVLFMGGWYWSLLSERSEKTALRDSLHQQRTQVQATLIEVQKFEGQKEELQKRINVIERLRENQKGPVVLMNEVIESIPHEPVLWLTSLTQKDEIVSIEGHALTVPSIADFIGRLDLQNTFQRVELEYWEQEENAIKFKINCQVRS